MSTSSTRFPLCAIPIARLTLVVVFPTPPFMFTIATRSNSGPPFGPQLATRLKLLHHQLGVPDIRTRPLPGLPLCVWFGNLVFFQQSDQCGVAQPQNGRNLVC